MSDLLSQLANLSAAEKVELLDTVWESLEANAQSLTEAQRAELDSRLARHEKNPSDVIPWEKVRAGLFSVVMRYAKDSYQDMASAISPE